jgi:hypothetical protein
LGKKFYPVKVHTIKRILTKKTEQVPNELLPISGRADHVAENWLGNGVIVIEGLIHALVNIANRSDRQLTHPPKATIVFKLELLVLILVKSSNNDAGRSSMGATRKSPGVIYPKEK